MPEHWADKSDPVYYVTARYTHAIETVVRRWPEQYLWMHRRWRRRPNWERQGKPMPRRLRANLEDLPWVDQAAMTRLLQPPDTDAAGNQPAGLPSAGGAERAIMAAALEEQDQP